MTALNIHILLKIKKYHAKRYKSIVFNMLFLRRMKKKYGTLHCVYCNCYVQVMKLGEPLKRSIMATVDHYLPKATHPELEFDESNLRVCCDKCNAKKGSKIWQEKYPYP